jgi:acyl carrier protein
VTSSKDLREPIHDVFRKVLVVEPPSFETDLIESGVLDSLALVELLFEIERQFQIELQLDELDVENFRTVERICELVARHGGVEASMGSEEMGPDRGEAMREERPVPPPHG